MAERLPPTWAEYVRLLSRPPTPIREVIRRGFDFGPVPEPEPPSEYTHVGLRKPPPVNPLFPYQMLPSTFSSFPRGFAGDPKAQIKAALRYMAQKQGAVTWESFVTPLTRRRRFANGLRRLRARVASCFHGTRCARTVPYSVACYRRGRRCQ